MTYTSILVAVNLRGGLDRPFERALALAKASNAELFALHAVPADRPFGSRAVERLHRTDALRDRADAMGVKMHVQEQHGDPAALIALHADARAADVIVMGTEPRSAWSRFWRPSVVDRVLRRTSRPVLVVPRDDEDTASAPESVLVAVDLSTSSGPLIAASMQLFGRDATQMTVVHGVESLESGGAVSSRARWLVPEFRGYILSDALGELEAALPPPRDTDVEAQLRVAAGPVVETIKATAADVEADLIVMGRGRRFMQPGATVTRVLRRTDRAVLVVPEAAALHIAGYKPSSHARAA
jgi:nucleotide-binding universal stress UspA family protein